MILLPQADLGTDQDEVGVEDNVIVAALWWGIPVQQLTADERKVLAGLEDQLEWRVIWQDDVVSAISWAVSADLDADEDEDQDEHGLHEPDAPNSDGSDSLCIARTTFTQNKQIQYIYPVDGVP